MTPLKIAITPGEPAGVGPDLVIELAQQEWPAQLVIFADETMMQERAAALNLPLKLTPYTHGETRIQAQGELYIQAIPTAVPVEPGVLSSDNGHYVVETLRQACQANIEGDFVNVSVCDESNGVAKKNLGAMFETDDVNPDAYGVGLKVIKDAIKSQGGDINYEKLEKTSRFNVLIPMTKG